MDFFEAQARAKKHTTRLVVLFSLAILGTVFGTYFAAVYGLRETHDYHPRRTRPGHYEFSSAPQGPVPSWWQPQLLLGVSMATLAVVGIASLWKWNEFSAGGSAVAESVGGRRVDPHTTDTHERRLLNVVEEMAIASGVPVPAVYIMDEEPAINAFAAGLTTSDAVVAVTRGTLEKLSRDELQGVVGHEFSHILNGDMRLNLRLTALVFGILVIGLLGRGLLYSIRFSRPRSSGDGKNHAGVLVAIAVIGLALMAIGYIGYFFGRLIQAAVSRQREYLADASAVQFTRNPGGLTGALKKIGGFALGSSIQSNKSAAIGHFFFAQGFRSHFGGLWATHPPLDERIRAIDPRFDGQMFAAPEVVDVSRESFATAGFAPAPPVVRAARPATPADVASLAPAALAALSAEHIANSQLLLDSTPPRLRAATQTPSDAQSLLFALLLDTDPSTSNRQRNLVAARAGGDALRALDDLIPFLRDLRPEHRLPLLQLALPALRQLPPTALDPFLDTLDELVHADTQVTIFEFTLQKLLVRTLALGRAPSAAVVQYHSFHAVAPEIAVVLSALAHLSAAANTLSAEEAFAAGASQLKLVESRLALLAPAACDLAALDGALDKLSAASFPIRQRTVTAAAHLIGADGQTLIAESELLRAIAATLDVPLPR